VWQGANGRILRGTDGQTKKKRVVGGRIWLGGLACG